MIGMKIISKIYETEEVSMVSFEKTPAQIGFISELFRRIADAGINVDMISQTAPKGEKNNLSFTIAVEWVMEVTALAARMNSGIKPLISSGNVKISLYGEAMPEYAGVAAGVFDLLNEAGIDILLITTSDVDISLVVSSANADRALAILKKAYLD